MEKKVILVCVSVGYLGVIAATLGFVAESKRIKVSDVVLNSDGGCLYPRSPALALGLIAALALLIAVVVINGVVGCICCRKVSYSSSPNWMISLIFYVVSWVTFVLAFLLFLMGAALNDQHVEERKYFGNYCFVVKAGVFAGGSILSIASVSFGIVYYLAVVSSSKEDEGVVGSNLNQGISMGRPQRNQPVFVHEDIYNRQQFP